MIEDTILTTPMEMPTNSNHCPPRSEALVKKIPYVNWSEEIMSLISACDETCYIMDLTQLFHRDFRLAQFKRNEGDVIVNLHSSLKLVVYKSYITTSSAYFATTYSPRWYEEIKTETMLNDGSVFRQVKLPELDFTNYGPINIIHLMRYAYVGDKLIIRCIDKNNVEDFFELLYLVDMCLFAHYYKYIMDNIIYNITFDNMFLIWDYSDNYEEIQNIIKKMIAYRMMYVYMKKCEPCCHLENSVRLCCIHENANNIRPSNRFCYYYTATNTDIPINKDIHNSNCCFHRKHKMENLNNFKKIKDMSVENKCIILEHMIDI